MHRTGQVWCAHEHRTIWGGVKNNKNTIHIQVKSLFPFFSLFLIVPPSISELKCWSKYREFRMSKSVFYNTWNTWFCGGKGIFMLCFALTFSSPNRWIMNFCFIQKPFYLSIPNIPLEIYSSSVTFQEHNTWNCLLHSYTMLWYTSILRFYS